jgi:penicillin-binding protein-related factor A (putative recombinase)
MEADFQQSCKDQHIFVHRIKDVYIPPEFRQKIQVPFNQYDFFFYYDGLLVPLEIKSTAQKSVSLDNSMIKEHQVKSLLEAAQYEGVSPGLLINYREYNNQTYFVHINDFVEYQAATKGEPKREYKSKVLKSSISLNICAEVGIEVKYEKKRVHYRYDVIGLVQEIKEKYCD